MKRRGELIQLNALFDKYKNHFKPPQQTVVQATVDIIEEVTGLQLDASKCSYTVASRTFSTGAPALIRQEIKMRHGEIVAHLKGRLGEHSAPVQIF
jgi:hypothetical protein